MIIRFAMVLAIFIVGTTIAVRKKFRQGNLLVLLALIIIIVLLVINQVVYFKTAQVTSTSTTVRFYEHDIASIHTIYPDAHIMPHNGQEVIDKIFHVESFSKIVAQELLIVTWDRRIVFVPQDWFRHIYSTK